MRKKAVLAILWAVLSVLLTGCFPWSAEESYKLPKPPKNYENLMSAVAQTKRELTVEHSATVEDVPPSTGDNTSTVQLLDMDGDGSLETAVTFFRIVGADVPIRIYFFTLQDEKYAVSNVVEGEGDGVYAVHYADMDGLKDPATGKGRKEVVVSWQMGSNAYYLGVYALDPAQKQAQTIVTTAYQNYQILDMDRDGLMELAVGHIDAEQKIGEVAVYDWMNGDQASEFRVPLSAGLHSIRQMRVDFLTGLVPALYVTGELVDGSRVTDVLSMQNGQPVNLSMDPETGVSRERVDAYREISGSDVNNDYIMEIGRPHPLPSYGAGNGGWLVDWVQYDSRGKAQPVCTTYHNTADGWYLIIPQDWVNKLAVYRNDSVSGQRAVVFALWQGQDKEPMPFLSIYKLTGASRSLRATSGDRFILAEDSSTIYAATFYNTWDCGLDETGLLENFRLIVSSWSD